MQVIATSVHKELNNFVLASILTVDDFMQFKAMMVKRNVDLTYEVSASRHYRGRTAPPRITRASSIQHTSRPPSSFHCTCENRLVTRAPTHPCESPNRSAPDRRPPIPQRSFSPPRGI
eukprot:419350-Pyramimonas_sp.AAC.1